VLAGTNTCPVMFRDESCQYPSLAMTGAVTDRSPARLDTSVVPGATPAPFSGFIEPRHPALRKEAPSGERWVHEIKFDGYRTQAHLHQGRPASYTRAGHDWTGRFQPIADALTAPLIAGTEVADHIYVIELGATKLKADKAEFDTRYRDTIGEWLI
jgi:ATP-dependent DNA ligase